ncbi:MAG: hypothetical protein ABJF01_04435 [bacterium]
MSRMGWITLSTIVLSVSACGGSADTPTLPGTGLPGGVLPKDTTTVGATTTSQQRMLAMDAVQLLINSLPPASFDANTKLLTEYLKALPQFVDVGSSADGTVWATFKGGQMMFIVDGAPETPKATQAGTSSAPTLPPSLLPAAFVATRAATAASPGTVPASAHFQLFNALGSYFSGSDPRSDIAAMLTANGYTGTSEDATLAALRTVSGDGIFYYRAHGGSGTYQSPSGTQTVYALWTASEALDASQEANDQTLTVDLAAHRVVYMLFRDDRWSRGLPKLVEPARHYGITGDFVSRYMSFSANSLIYLDACNSSNHPELYSAFKNASVVVGWDERALIELLGLSARYVFDRLLGSNTFAPEVPKQRPFEYDALPGDPKFGKPNAFGYSKAPAAGGGTIEAELHLKQIGGDFGILAPSISSLGLNGLTDELYVFGYFGADPGPDGKLTINDGTGEVALAVASWTPTKITTVLPRKGTGSAGNVVVSVRGHKSNARQIVAWQGTLVYTESELGTLNQRFEMDVVARVDPQDTRIQIAKAPQLLFTPPFDANQSVQTRYTAGGTYSGPFGPCTLTEDWKASGSIPANIISLSGQPQYFYSGLVDPTKSVMQLTFGALEPDGLQESGAIKCPGGSPTPSTSARDIAVDPHILDEVGGLLMMNLSLDGGLNIVAGSRQRSIPSEIDPTRNATLSLQWPTIKAFPAVDRTLPR